MKLFVAIILMLSATVRADVIGVEGHPPILGVTVTALHEGQLSYQLSSGRESNRPIDQIEYMQIGGWTLFNAAEKQQREKHYREAAANYEKAIAEITPPEFNHLDRALLLRCRLVRVYDADGQFDRAVRVYLDVLDGEGGVIYLESLRPQHLPQSGSSFLRSATEMLDRAIGRHANDPIGASLGNWRAQWPGASSRPAETKITAPAAQPQATAVGSRDDIRELVEKGRYRTALEKIEQYQKSGPPKPELFYWQGRALLGLKEENPEQTAINQRRAGLAFMRVVIHFPEHVYAPECLYRAGEICAKTGDLQQAAVLWSGLLDRYPTAQEWTDPARRNFEQISRDPNAAAKRAANRDEDAK